MQMQFAQNGIEDAEVSYPSDDVLQVVYRTPPEQDHEDVTSSIVGVFFGWVRQDEWSPASLRVIRLDGEGDAPTQYTARAEWRPPDDSEQAWREALEKVEETKKLVE
jgi:hypothetical protein